MDVRIEHNGKQFAIYLSQRPAAIEAVLAQNLARGVLEVQRAQRELAPKAFTELTQSIQSEKVTPLEWMITAAKNYATAVEEGTGAGGVAPLQALKDWIKIKGIRPNNSNMDIDDLAFLFQRSIAAKGTPAQPFMRPGLESKIPRLQKLVQQAIKQGLK